MTQNKFSDRNSIAEYVIKKIKNEPSNFFCFIGKNGTGKKYVLDIIENSIKDKFKIYKVVGDSIFEKQQKTVTHSLKFSFSLVSFLGLSLTPSKNDITKVNYIISNLKPLFSRKNIIISATDYDILDPVSRDFLNVLIKNKRMIESKIKRKITIIITGTINYFDVIFNVEYIRFSNYTKEDLKTYLLNSLHYFEFEITPNKLSRLYSLCGTNFELVNCYHKYILDENSSINDSIEALIDQKLNYYITAGQKYNLSITMLKDIIYVSSLSVNLLFPRMISRIMCKEEADVDIAFSCAVDEYFLKKASEEIYTITNYTFISNDIKQYLLQTAIGDYSNQFINYYNFLLCYVEDEYFERAQYLFNYFGNLNEFVFTLLIFALSKAFLINDDINKRNIEDFINKNADAKFLQLYHLIAKAYKEHYLKNYRKSLEILEKVDFSAINILLSSELRRLQFKSEQLSREGKRHIMRQHIMQLYNYVERDLVLVNLQKFAQKDEKILSLRIIFDIAPYVLDTMNDKELFSKLYDKSLILAKYINDNFIKESFSQYVINVFNRKAFLFATPEVALLYYEEAAEYFRKNKIDEQYAITLASKSGIDIALTNYKTAISEIKKSIQIINECNLNVQQIEKIYNNLYIAEFLDYEINNTSIDKIYIYALQIIKKLEKLLSNEPNGKNHVILTNLSSLSLYVHNESDYQNYKAKIEMSLGCQDVSNIDDQSVNDFYRYHFAWFEFYRNFHNENWEICKSIIVKLTGFYPSIFHDISKMNARIEAANHLVEKQIKLTPRDYCLNFLNYSNKPQNFQSRGLLLSDLQFTTLD